MGMIDAKEGFLFFLVWMLMSSDKGIVLQFLLRQSKNFMSLSREYCHYLSALDTSL